MQYACAPAYAERGRRAWYGALAQTAVVVAVVVVAESASRPYMAINTIAYSILTRFYV